MDPAELRARFDRDGCVAIGSVLDRGSVARWLHHLGAQSIPPNGVAAVALDRDPVARVLAADPRLDDLAAAALGAPVDVFALTYLVKPAGSDLSVSWHQDGHPWRHELGIEAAVTLWLALDPATAASGCLQVIPGSHRLPLRPLEPVVGRPDMFGWRSDPTTVDEAAAVAIELVPGDASLHHPALLHRSGSNRTGRRRAAVAVRFRLAPGGGNQRRTVTV